MQTWYSAHDIYNPEKAVIASYDIVDYSDLTLMVPHTAAHLLYILKTLHCQHMMALQLCQTFGNT